MVQEEKTSSKNVARAAGYQIGRMLKKKVFERKGMVVR